MLEDITVREAFELLAKFLYCNMTLHEPMDGAWAQPDREALFR